MHVNLRWNHIVCNTRDVFILLVQWFNIIFVNHFLSPEIEPNTVVSRSYMILWIDDHPRKQSDAQSNLCLHSISNFESFFLSFGPSSILQNAHNAELSASSNLTILDPLQTTTC